MTTKPPNFSSAQNNGAREYLFRVELEPESALGAPGLKNLELRSLTQREQIEPFPRLRYRRAVGLVQPMIPRKL
jgi:hypothetical protein